MSTAVKIALYVVLTVAACLFGFIAYSNYAKLMSASEVQTTPPASDDLGQQDDPLEIHAYAGYSKVLTFGAFFVISIVGLGLLVGHDAAHLLGSKTIKMLYNDEGEGMAAAPDYEAAEQKWADGQYLDAIGLMRDHLKKNPREQHVALRIAEIYEKDLNNHLAAALEYEEILEQKLEAERWGWAAIHLCNLYNKLDQHPKAVDLLRRIDTEYGQTAAADKARKRLTELGIPTTQDIEEESEEESGPVEENLPPRPPSKLPPGFAPKKG